MRIVLWFVAAAVAAASFAAASPAAKEAAPAPKTVSYKTYKEAYEAGNKALAGREWDAAVDAYSQAAGLGSGKASQSKAQNAKGWVLLKARRLADAQAAFQAAVDLDPKSTLALSNLAFAAYLQYESGSAGEEALTKAKESLEACKSINENFKSDVCDRVKTALERIDAYAKATPIAEEPKPGMGYKAAASLGDAAQAQGQFDLAIRAFEIAEKDASSAAAKGSAANRKGKALLDARRPKEALVCFERAVKIQPNEKVFLNNLGYAHWVLYDSGQGGVEALKAALDTFVKVNSIDPSYRKDNLDMALDELRQVDPEAAKAYDKTDEGK
jgi:tetratricopeptide (TPR) repeat protein